MLQRAALYVKASFGMWKSENWQEGTSTPVTHVLTHTHIHTHTFVNTRHTAENRTAHRSPFMASDRLFDHTELTHRIQHYS